jgi:hypothetical protein
LQRFLRWTVPIAIAIMFLGAFSPTNLAAANAVSGDHNVATINNVGSAADQLIALNTDSNLNPNQMVLLRSYGHDGQTQQAIAMDNDGCGTQVASTKGNFEGMWTALMATHRHVGHQQIAYGNSSGLQHLQANTGATFNGTRQQYAMGIATTFNPPGRRRWRHSTRRGPTATSRGVTMPTWAEQRWRPPATTVCARCGSRWASSRS